MVNCSNNVLGFENYMYLVSCIIIICLKIKGKLDFYRDSRER